MRYFAIVALTFVSIDSTKHFRHRLSPEYGLKKKASLTLQDPQRFAMAFTSITFQSML